MVVAASERRLACSLVLMAIWYSWQCFVVEMETEIERERETGGCNEERDRACSVNVVVGLLLVMVFAVLAGVALFCRH